MDDLMAETRRILSGLDHGHDYLAGDEESIIRQMLDQGSTPERTARLIAERRHAADRAAARRRGQ